jgi:carboxyl-terminal processing protease
LDQYSKREYSLNINQYKADQKQLKSIYKDMDSVVKLSTPMNMKSLEADAQFIAGDEEKVTKNKQWMDMRKKDVYIDESVKIIDKMIQQGNLVIKQ